MSDASWNDNSVIRFRYFLQHVTGGRSHGVLVLGGSTGTALWIGWEGKGNRMGEGRKSYIRFTTWICITGHSVLWCFTLSFLFVYLSGPVEAPGSGRGHLDGVQLEPGLMA